MVGNQNFYLSQIVYSSSEDAEAARTVAAEGVADAEHQIVLATEVQQLIADVHKQPRRGVDL